MTYSDKICKCCDKGRKQGDLISLSYDIVLMYRGCQNCQSKYFDFVTNHWNIPLRLNLYHQYRFINFKSNQQIDIIYLNLS